MTEHTKTQKKHSKAEWLTVRAIVRNCTQWLTYSWHHPLVSAGHDTSVCSVGVWTPQIKYSRPTCVRFLFLSQSKYWIFSFFWLYLTYHSSVSESLNVNIVLGVRLAGLYGCPICGIGLSGAELDTHYTQELDDLTKISLSMMRSPELTHTGSRFPGSPGPGMDPAPRTRWDVSGNNSFVEPCLVLQGNKTTYKQYCE